MCVSAAAECKQQHDKHSEEDEEEDSHEEQRASLKPQKQNELGLNDDTSFKPANTKQNSI